MGNEIFKIDHLAFACKDLAKGVKHIHAKLGIEPSFGGKHELLGTANYLLSLGSNCYLEVVGPNPEISTSKLPEAFQIDQIESDQLTLFAITEPNIDGALARLSERNIHFGNKLSMSRRLKDNSLLSWTLSDLRYIVGNGIVPFLVNWGQNTIHPSQSSAQGCTLESIRLEHPDPNPIEQIFDILNFKCDIHKGLRPKIICTIKCPNGLVELS